MFLPNFSRKNLYDIYGDTCYVYCLEELNVICVLLLHFRMTVHKRLTHCLLTSSFNFKFKSNYWLTSRDLVILTSEDVGIGINLTILSGAVSGLIDNLKRLGRGE